MHNDDHGQHPPIDNPGNDQTPIHNDDGQPPYNHTQPSLFSMVFDKLFDRPHLLLIAALILAVLAHFFSLSLLFLTIIFASAWIRCIHTSKTRYRTLLLVLGYTICLLAFGYILWGFYQEDSSIMNLIDEPF